MIKKKAKNKETYTTVDEIKCWDGLKFNNDSMMNR